MPRKSPADEELRPDAWPAPTENARRWSPKYALLAFIVAVVLAGAIAAGLRLLGITFPDATGTLVLDATLLGALAPLYRSGALRARDLGFRRAPGARSVGAAVATWFGYTLFASAWISAAHPPPVHNVFEGVDRQSTLVIVLAGFAAAVSAPVVEETFFRGFLYGSLRNRLPVLWACLISGLLFGAIHFQYPLSVRPVLAGFGIAMCLLYEWTGSLLPGIAVHSLLDASGFEYGLTGSSVIVLLAFAAVALALLALPPLRWLRRAC